MHPSNTIALCIERCILPILCIERCIPPIQLSNVLRDASFQYNSQNFFLLGRFSGDIKFCTHTETQTDPWWWVDLGCERTVAKVTVSNRGDCCGDRLNGFKIAVGNDVSVNGGTGNTPCGGGYTVSVEYNDT